MYSLIRSGTELYQLKLTQHAPRRTRVEEPFSPLFYTTTSSTLSTPIGGEEAYELLMASLFQIDLPAKQ